MDDMGLLTSENPSRPHGVGPLDPETMVPHPKNPVIGAFFREIGRAEELGSGMLNLMKYGRRYGGADPQFIEGDTFRIVVAVPQIAAAHGAGASVSRADRPPNRVRGRSPGGDRVRDEICRIGSSKPKLSPEVLAPGIRDDRRKRAQAGDLGGGLSWPRPMDD